MKTTWVQRRAAFAVRAPLHVRIRRWFFRQRKPRQRIAVPTAWLIDRKREQIGDDLPLEIWEQPTQPLHCVAASVPARGYWFYEDETTAVPINEDPNATRKIPILS